MRLLILGGTRFLSQAVATAAVVRGHDVTCAARGRSGHFPEGVERLELDRSAPDWSPFGGREWDAVVDVARTPSWVTAALDALADRVPHWVFVSTVSVYADQATPGGTPETLTLLEPLWEDDSDVEDPYGPHKVACERLVQERTTGALVVRPGLVIGPGDPSGRFTYWPERLAEGGEVLAPESPDRPTQAIDVRDLAAWLVRCAEERRAGVLDASGPVRRLGDLFDAVADAVGGRVETVWAPAEFLLERHVAYWAGPRSLPLWLPEEFRGLTAHDVGAAVEAGLSCRPVGQTAYDTLAWIRESNGDVPRTGLSRAEEQELLDDWHTIRV